MEDFKIIQITPISKNTRVYYEDIETGRDFSFPIVAIALIEHSNGSTEARYLMQDDIGKLTVLNDNEKNLLYVH